MDSHEVVNGLRQSPPNIEGAIQFILHAQMQIDQKDKDLRELGQIAADREAALASRDAALQARDKALEEVVALRTRMNQMDGHPEVQAAREKKRKLLEERRRIEIEIEEMER